MAIKRGEERNEIVVTGTRQKTHFRNIRDETEHQSKHLAGVLLFYENLEIYHFLTGYDHLRLLFSKLFCAWYKCLFCYILA